MLSLACRDTGAKVIECDYVARGMTEEELWKNGTDHIVKAHSMKIEDITPQFKNYYKRYIKHS
jgi:predicted small metal-binding protein